MILRVFATLQVLFIGVVANASMASELAFDAVVVFTDGRADTVYDVWEYIGREPTRELSYLDGGSRLQIPYARIASVTFSRLQGDSKKTAITLSLTDASEKKGLLWSNDSFYGTTKDGQQWRGRIVALKKLTFIPATRTHRNASTTPAPLRGAASPAPSRPGGGG